MKTLQQILEEFDEQFPILTDEIDSKNRFARTVGGDVKHFIREQVTAIVSQIGVGECEACGEVVCGVCPECNGAKARLGETLGVIECEECGGCGHNSCLSPQSASQEVERQKQIILNGEKG